MKPYQRDEQFRIQLLDRFRKSGAHADLGEVLNGISWEQAGKSNNTLPYNIWQLSEHIRISQYDILEFCRNPGYDSPVWPSGYWPTNSAPESERIWHNAIAQIKKDHEDFADLLTQPDAELLERFDHGTGQSLFNEAVLIMDHNAYHAGQIVLIRKINGWWDLAHGA